MQEGDGAGVAARGGLALETDRRADKDKYAGSRAKPMLAPVRPPVLIVPVQRAHEQDSTFRRE